MGYSFFNSQLNFSKLSAVGKDYQQANSNITFKVKYEDDMANVIVTKDLPKIEDGCGGFLLNANWVYETIRNNIGLTISIPSRNIFWSNLCDMVMVSCYRFGVRECYRVEMIDPKNVKEIAAELWPYGNPRLFSINFGGENCLLTDEEGSNKILKENPNITTVNFEYSVKE